MARHGVVIFFLRQQWMIIPFSQHAFGGTSFSVGRDVGHTSVEVLVMLLLH